MLFLAILWGYLKLQWFLKTVIDLILSSFLSKHLVATLLAGLTPINDHWKLRTRDIFFLFYSGDNKATVTSFYANYTFTKCLSDYDIIQNKSFLYSKSFEFIMQTHLLFSLVYLCIILWLSPFSITENTEIGEFVGLC